MTGFGLKKRDEAKKMEKKRKKKVVRERIEARPCPLQRGGPIILNQNKSDWAVGVTANSELSPA